MRFFTGWYTTKHNMATVVIPKKLNLSDKMSAANVQRKNVSVQGDKSTYLPGQRTYIDLPSHPSDLKGSYLVFNAQITTPGGGSTYDRFSWPMGSQIERIRILAGSEVIETIDEYQVLHGAMANLYSGDLITGQALAALGMEGSYVPATRATNSILDNVYSIKLFADSLRQFWPLHRINSQFRIEITWAQPATCLESDGAAPSYTIHDVLFYYDQLTLPKDISDMIDRDIANGSYELVFSPFQAYSDTSLGSSTRADLAVPARYETAQKTLVIVRESASISSLIVDNKTTQYSTNINTITEAAIKLNNQYFPPDRMPELANDASDFHWTLLRRFCDSFDDLSGAKGRAYNTVASTDWKTASRQCIAIDFRQNPHVSGLKGNGVVLNEAGATMRVQFALGTGYTAAIVNTFINFVEVIKILPGGAIIVSF